MHQPPGNLDFLFEGNNWEAQQIICCYERAARYAHKYKDVAKFHVGFSGILLEQFKDKNIIEKYRQFVDIPAMIENYRRASNAQESGLNPEWFLNEVNYKIKECSQEGQDYLVTTWSDGENGGWFRQRDEMAGFFGYFFAPLLEKIKAKTAPIYMTKLSDFLKTHPAREETTVRAGAWNVGSTSGYDFSQWNGSESQRRAIQELFKTSQRYWDFKKEKETKEKLQRLERAHQLILDAETSCYLFGERTGFPEFMKN